MHSYLPAPRQAASHPITIPSARSPRRGVSDYPSALSALTRANRDIQGVYVHHELRRKHGQPPYDGGTVMGSVFH